MTWQFSVNDAAVRVWARRIEHQAAEPAWRSPFLSHDTAWRLWVGLRVDRGEKLPRAWKKAARTCFIPRRLRVLVDRWDRCKAVA